MIYIASYFDKKAHFGELMSISNTEPEGFEVDRKSKTLVPPWEIVDGYKKGRLTWEEYVEAYNKHLSKEWGTTAMPRFLEKFNGDRDITLLCWCRNEERCHRSLVADWLEARGYNVARNELFGEAKQKA